jgi:hypothetical protein
MKSPMPMLAEIDDPPRPRWPGVLKGLLIAGPLVIATAVWGLPRARAVIIEGASNVDARIEVEGAYMQGLCTDAIVLGRDERLCKCVLGSEEPGVDCVGAFQTWTIARQIDQCAVPANNERALSFCACVDTLKTDLSGLERVAENEEARRLIVANYSNCAKLEDALFLPELSELKKARKVCRKKGALEGFEAYCQCKSAIESELESIEDSSDNALARAAVVDRFSTCTPLFAQGMIDRKALLAAKAAENGNESGSAATPNSNPEADANLGQDEPQE